jgi:hypothetical protein
MSTEENLEVSRSVRANIRVGELEGYDASGLEMMSICDAYSCGHARAKASR